MREFPKPETDKDAEVLGKHFISSIQLKQIRIYDYNYRTMYSSDPKGPGFHKGLRLLGMQLPVASWLEDTDGFLLYRNSSGDLYLQILKEDGDRIVQEASGSKKSFLPRDFSEGILYWVYKKKEEDSELLETNLSPDSTLLPGIEVSNSEESKAMIHALLDKNSKPQNFLIRPVWEKTIEGDLEIFLSQPRKTRAEELLLILSAFGISLIALICGILASKILFTIRTENRFSEREEVIQVKTELVRLLGQFREKTK